MKIYNTLTKEKKEFEPIDKENNIVRIYSCGPTVYDYAHIGNMRTYIFMDTLIKVLKYNGYKLKHVMNITDVGHLTSDADEGEDKMQKAANREKKSPYEIADFYTKVFFEDFKKLNIKKPDIIAKATEHIPEMIEYVQKIIDNGYVYETSSGIYFDISKLPSYGILSGKKLEGEKAGARIEIDDEKKNPYDFAIWKKASPNHIMQWESPWGMSFPGWHLECSAMSRKYLGDEFDIHTGGVDHIPIHHENEMAQSIGATGKIPARNWMHCEFLKINNGKMSKSLGNVYTINDLEKEGVEAIAYRYFTYLAHYRTKLNFTWEAVKSAQVTLNRLRDAVRQQKLGKNNTDEEKIKEYERRFEEAINDDINMPLAIAVVWDVAKEKEKSKDYYDLLMKFDEILSLDLDKEEKEIKIECPEEVYELLKERKEARENKNYAKSDELRDKIREYGFEVKDTRDGQILETI